MPSNTMQAEALIGDFPGAALGERRADVRYAPQTRAAVWFNIGISTGELSELVDISVSGFAVRCDEWQLPAFLATEGRSLYCVLLLGEAHFGCMVRMVSRVGHTGQVGFRFDAIPEDSLRLVHGLIDAMQVRLADQEQISSDA